MFDALKLSEEAETLCSTIPRQLNAVVTANHFLRKTRTPLLYTTKILAAYDPVTHGARASAAMVLSKYIHDIVSCGSKDFFSVSMDISIYLDISQDEPWYFVPRQITQYLYPVISPRCCNHLVHRVLTLENHWVPNELQLHAKTIFVTSMAIPGMATRPA